MDTLVFEIYEGEGKLRMIFKRGEEVGYEVFRFDRDCFKDGIPDYAKIVSQTVADYLGQEKVAKMIYVLPDKYVFYDYVETPVIFGKSRQSMIDLELASRFSLHGAYKTAVVPVARAKGKVTSVAFMARKNHLSAIYNAMKQLRPKTSSVTFEAAMYANAFLTCDPPQRHTATMFAAVRGQRTKVAVVKEDRLLFFTDIP